jgi:hypothetical protein
MRMADRALGAVSTVQAVLTRIPVEFGELPSLRDDTCFHHRMQMTLVLDQTAQAYKRFQSPGAFAPAEVANRDYGSGLILTGRLDPISRAERRCGWELADPLARRVPDGVGNGAVSAARSGPEIRPDEVMRALVGICYTRDQSDWQETVTRLINVFVHGLRSGSIERGRP